MTDAVHFDESTWPLVYVRYPREFSVAVVKGTIDGFERIHQRNQRFLVLLDATHIKKFPGSTERDMLAQWLGQPGHAEREARDTVGTAVVLDSGPLRAMLSAIQWVAPPKSPRVWKATVPEAFEWLYERLVEAKIPITPAIEGLRTKLRMTPALGRQ